MNITESFVEYLESKLFGTLGTDIFIGTIPQDAPDNCYLLIGAGGSPLARNQTGEVIKNYSIDLYYRNLSAEAVYNTMQSLEIEINKANCTQLTGFDTMEMQATLFPSDQDIDNQDRTVGLVQVLIKTYYKE